MFVVAFNIDEEEGGYICASNFCLVAISCRICEEKFWYYVSISEIKGDMSDFVVNRLYYWNFLHLLI